MKLFKASGIVGGMALAAIASQTTLADDRVYDSGWYIGGNIGQSHADIDDERITRNLLDSGFTDINITDDNRDKGYKLYGGYQFNRYFAVEGGYFDLGKFEFTATTLPVGTLDGRIKLKGLNADVVGFLPITEKFSAFGRVGVNYAEAKDTFSGTGSVHVLNPTASERKANPKVGVGLQYAFTDALAMRVEAERYRINDAVGNKGDIDLVSIGLVYRFGTKATPAPVAPIVEPAPAPVVVTPPPPPPAPRFEKYTLSATELFGFDSSAVNLPQMKLEEITTAIKSNDAPKQIVIVGYSDRLGSDAYNQKLSERRAVAVKEYMVNRGVEADRLIAEGRGEEDPIVVCNDTNKTALIECLKPNRRVEIDQVKMVREVKK